MFLLASSHGKIEFCNNISVTSSVGCLFFFFGASEYINRHTVYCGSRVKSYDRGHLIPES